MKIQSLTPCFSLQGFEPKQHHQNHQGGLLWHQEPQDSVSLVYVSAKPFTFWLDESGCSADIKGMVILLSSNLIVSLLRFTLMSHRQSPKNTQSAGYRMVISETYFIPFSINDLKSQLQIYTKVYRMKDFLAGSCLFNEGHIFLTEA